MKRFLNRILCVTLIAALLYGVHGEAAASTSAELERQKSNLQNQLNQNREGIENANAQAEDARAEKSELSGAIGETNTELVQVIAGVDLIKTEIAETENSIAETQAAYDEAKAFEEALYEQMKQQIRFMYEQGDTRYVQILLEAGSFSDMLNKADYVEKLYAFQNREMDAYVAAQDEASMLKYQLEEQRSELETSRYELEQEQAYLEQMLASYRRQYADADARLAQAQADAAAYKEKVQKQTAEIAKLTDQIARKKAEEEAQRRAEEARKAAEAQARAAAQAAASSGSGTKSNTSQQTASSKTYAPAGSATGANVAKFACQFIGNRYVMGGTSLTNGTDCSGFVMSVYRNFGISLPRTSYAQRNVGRAVSLSEAQPGDIVCYAGHVGIYIGGGNIVHASSARTGIKISPAAYRSVLTVRRVL